MLLSELLVHNNDTIANSGFVKVYDVVEVVTLSYPVMYDKLEILPIFGRSVISDLVCVCELDAYSE